jgi:hypothetical protein
MSAPEWIGLTLDDRDQWVLARPDQRQLLYRRADLHADALRAAREALAAIERLATNLGIASCSCGIKSPDIQWHAGHCPYVLVTYILVQAEDALAALDREGK